MEQPARHLVPLDRRAQRSTRAECIAQHRQLLLDSLLAPARYPRRHLDPITHTIGRMTTRSLNDLAIHSHAPPEDGKASRQPHSAQGVRQTALTA